MSRKKSLEEDEYKEMEKKGWKTGGWRRTLKKRRKRRRKGVGNRRKKRRKKIGALQCLYRNC